MEFTLIVDCGTHTTKYTGQGKRNRRKDWPEGQVREAAAPSLDTKESSDHAFGNLWPASLSSLISKEVEADEALTLVLLIDTFAPRALRESLFQLGFEHYGAKKMAVCNATANALFTAGDTSGVGVDIGYSSVRITPVDRGVPLPWLGTTLPGVGAAACDQAIDRCLQELREGDASLPSPSAPGLVARDAAFTAAKAKLLCFGDERLPDSVLAPSDPEVDSDTSAGHRREAAARVCNFPLPDGGHMFLPCTPEYRFRATRPLLYSKDVNVPATFASVFQKYCVSCGDGAAPQWMCFGGGAAVPGVSAELATGLGNSLFGLPDHQITTRNPLTAAVEGARILTHLSSFKGMCVSLSEYEEDGPSLCVHVKPVDPR